MFKVGDKVLCTSYEYGVDQVFGTIARIDGSKYISVSVNEEAYEKASEGIKTYGSDDELLFLREELKLAALINSLNKKLYPNRVECQGYLLPAEIADQINEENEKNS